MYRAVFLALACVLAVSDALVGKVCTVESECDAGECCQILSQFMVMSRRQVDILPLATSQKNGTCQKYQLEGSGCYNLDKMNGYCSCEPGTYCHTYEIPWTTVPPTAPPTEVNKRMPPLNRPGFMWISRCERQTA
ncbi:uncharacterized protein LOC131937704 [Physella acuta]|uniref:uncharacterized protein LOC131937704 n=1 Tax=Physella acuta TaxID=109671 RepID=UPI0027DBFC6C|nr:uncharacterized protein LOC131937704 [Physella acuta]